MSRGGPATAEGKRIAALNSLKHGINSTHILPCKKQKCFYWSTCMFNIFGLQNLLDDLDYGDQCPVEVALVINLSSMSVPTGFTEDDKEQLIRIQLKQRRCQEMAAINSDITRKVKQNQVLSLSYRYSRELRVKACKCIRSSAVAGKICSL